VELLLRRLQIQPNVELLERLDDGFAIGRQLDVPRAKSITLFTLNLDDLKNLFDFLNLKIQIKLSYQGGEHSL
jgi:hypothetical protein